MPLQLHTMIPPDSSSNQNELAPWLDAVRAQLRRRLRNPTLRTLTIVDLDLRPHGDRYWARDTERIAVVTLAPGLCGYGTVAHLTSAARDELVETIAAICHVDRVVLRAFPALRARLTDGLVVAGFLGGSLGVIGALPLSLPLVCGVAACGAISAHAGYAFAPPEP
jgi:hypothetical protein